MMRLEWTKGELLQGTLVYRAAEYSIDFEVSSTGALNKIAGTRGLTSLLFGTLQVEVSVESGDLLYPWGLFPRARWQVGRLQAPEFVGARVRLVADEPLKTGVSRSFPSADSWRIVRDGVTGWICFGDQNVRPGAVALEYATDAGVVLVGDQVTSLWLRPLL